MPESQASCLPRLEGPRPSPRARCPGSRERARCLDGPRGEPPAGSRASRPRRLDEAGARLRLPLLEVAGARRVLRLLLRQLPRPVQLQPDPASGHRRPRDHRGRHRLRQLVHVLGVRARRPRARSPGGAIRLPEGRSRGGARHGRVQRGDELRGRRGVARDPVGGGGVRQRRDVGSGHRPHRPVVVAPRARPSHGLGAHRGRNRPAPRLDPQPRGRFRVGLAGRASLPAAPHRPLRHRVLVRGPGSAIGRGPSRLLRGRRDLAQRGERGGGPHPRPHRLRPPPVELALLRRLPGEGARQRGALRHRLVGSGLLRPGRGIRPRHHGLDHVRLSGRLPLRPAHRGGRVRSGVPKQPLDHDRDRGGGERSE